LRVAVLIDGGHLRVLARKANKKYDPDFIEKIAYSCVIEPEVLLRILYYDCAPFAGEVKLPISGEAHKFEGSDLWLRRLSERDLFAVRRGILKFRGFKPKYIPVGSRKLTDEDFKPDFEQKGVDMRIGLDIANYASTRAVDRLILITGDTDCLPAMKHARIAGLQIALVEFPKTHLSAELLAHSDFRRAIQWPG
jgi:uncharacterized LabA/DUF88 family protein